MNLAITAHGRHETSYLLFKGSSRVQRDKGEPCQHINNDPLNGRSFRSGRV